MNLSNKQLNLEQNQAVMQAYEKESMKFSMSSEMSNQGNVNYPDFWFV